MTLSLPACKGDKPSTASESDAQEIVRNVIDPFIDITRQSGLAFTHDNGGTGRFYMPEIMGSGGALIDVDQDGDLDLYLLQGGPIEDDGLPVSDQLFRNDTVPDSGEIRFTNITEASGIPAGGYGMGAATGDIDNDGLNDLYITNFGDNRLLKNNGDGTFSDITESAGVADDLWTVPASFFDLEGDGDLDLLSASYVDFRLANHRDCFSATGLPDYCSPHSYNAVPDRLFLNQGNGRFKDISASAGLRKVPSKALGVISGDFNQDGFTDLYVANDGIANQLWLNQGDGTFSDDALFSGSALNYEGMPEASMGVDAADIDNDGDEDLFMTHLRGETNTLYLNQGQGVFEDRTIRMGLAGPSIPYTGFGTAWIDIENDGNLDILAVNGAVTVEEHLVQAKDSFPYHQPNQLFKNVSTEDALKFEPYPQQTKSAFADSQVSRGALIGDLDNDGDLDVIVSNNSGSAQLLQNQLGQDNNWLGLSLKLAENGADALGSSARISLGNNVTLMRRVRTSGSYVSANDPRILFGLGALEPNSMIMVTVDWVGGNQESFGPLKTGQYHTLVKGSGIPTRIQGTKP